MFVGVWLRGMCFGVLRLVELNGVHFGRGLVFSFGGLICGTNYGDIICVKERRARK